MQAQVDWLASAETEMIYAMEPENICIVTPLAHRRHRPQVVQVLQVEHISSDDAVRLARCRSSSTTGDAVDAFPRGASAVSPNVSLSCDTSTISDTSEVCGDLTATAYDSSVTSARYASLPAVRSPPGPAAVKQLDAVLVAVMIQSNWRGKCHRREARARGELKARLHRTAIARAHWHAALEYAKTVVLAQQLKQKSGRGCGASCDSGAKMRTVMENLATQSHFTWVLAVCASQDGRFIYTGSFAAGPIDAKAEEPSSCGSCCLPSGPADIEKGAEAGAVESEAMVRRSKAIVKRRKAAMSRSYLGPAPRLRGDNPILMWATVTGECVGHFFGHTSSVTAITCSFDDRLLFSGSGDGYLRVWSIVSRKQLYELSPVHPAAISSIVLSPARATSETLQFFFSAGGSEAHDQTEDPDNCIRKWRVDSMLQRPKQMKRMLVGHTKWVRQLLLNNASTLLFSASNDGTIIMWDAARLMKLQTFIGHGLGSALGREQGVKRNILSRGLTVILSGPLSGSAAWNSATASPKGQAPRHTSTSSPSSGGGSPSRKACMPTDSTDSNVNMHWVCSIQLIETVDGVGSLQRRLFSAGNDGTMRSWDVSSGQQVYCYQVNKSPLTCLVADSGGSMYTGSRDGYVNQWDIRVDPKMEASCAPKPICSYFTQSGVSCMALLNKRELITSSHDTTLECWRVDKLLPLNAKASKRMKDAPVRLTPSRVFTDISKLDCINVFAFEVFCHVQLFVAVFPRGDFLSPTSTPPYVHVPITAIRVITTGELPFTIDQQLYLVLPICLALQGSVILFVMLDVQGKIVRYLETRRQAGNGIVVQVDFEFQSGSTRTGMLL